MLRSFADPSKLYDLSKLCGMEGKLVSIGRDDEAMIKLDRFFSPTGPASRHHAQIQLFQGRFYLTDLGSLNGTFVNRQGSRIDCAPMIPLELGNGDTVLFGSPNRWIVQSKTKLICQNSCMFLFNEVAVHANSDEINNMDIETQPLQIEGQPEVTQPIFRWIE